MPQIQQLPPHLADLIAAGEVVERPASVVKELVENAIDAGASAIVVEIQRGGMGLIRVTDNGCSIAPEELPTAFLRHATSKLRTAEDLAKIGTLGFRGEALAAISAVSRVDVLTRRPEDAVGAAIHGEGGHMEPVREEGAPEGTTIRVSDLFYNTPARMKFMKSDSVEGSRVTAAVQMQALAHPQVAITLLRDGKNILSTPGDGSLQTAVYCVYGREFAGMAQVESHWDSYRLTGYVTKPTDSRPSRNFQTFFVNDRPVKSKLLISALEEAYRNQLMVGKFPAGVLHLQLPPDAVDVNVHPAKTEVKFLNEKAVFDCVHYGVLAALNKTPDRPQVQFAKQTASAPQPVQPRQAAVPKQNFFRTMTPEEYKSFSAAIQEAPQPKPQAAQAAVEKIVKAMPDKTMLHSAVVIPGETIPVPPRPAAKSQPEGERTDILPPLPAEPEMPKAPEIPVPPVKPEQPETVQQKLDMPSVPDWRLVGELYRTYILVEQGENAFLIDKHAAHERILFDKLKANQEAISGQALLSPLTVRLTPAAAGELLSNMAMMEELGFQLEEFGDSTLLLRQIPMDLSPDAAAEAVESLATDLLNGRREQKDTVRDELLHTVACKAAIKAGWVTDEQELYAIAKTVMEREELKYCPHGRPICVSLSKKQVEKQFKRT